MSFIQTHIQAAGVMHGAGAIYQEASNFVSRGDLAISDIKRLLDQRLPWVLAKAQILHELLQDTTAVTELAKGMAVPKIAIKIFRQRDKMVTQKPPLSDSIALAEEYLAIMDNWSWYLHKCQETCQQADLKGSVGVGFDSFFGTYLRNSIKLWESQQRSHFGPPKPRGKAPPPRRPRTVAPMTRPVITTGAPKDTSGPKDKEIDLFADD